MKKEGYWERFIKNLPKSYKEWFKEEKKYLMKNITKNSKVLDVGCGEGRSLNDILPKTKKLTGIDYDPSTVKVARDEFKDYPTIKIFKANAKKLPFKNNYFDYVICMTSFANFGKDKYKILKEMKRVLKRDGDIIISVFSEDAFKERMKVYKKTKAQIKEIKGTTVIFDESLRDCISEQFSKKELIEIFYKVNLKLVEIKKIGIAYICKLKK